MSKRTIDTEEFAKGWNLALLQVSKANLLSLRRNVAGTKDWKLGVSMYEEMLDMYGWAPRTRPTLFQITADFGALPNVVTRFLNIVAVDPQGASAIAIKTPSFDSRIPTCVSMPARGQVPMVGEVVADLVDFTMGDEPMPVFKWNVNDPALFAVAEKAMEIKNLRLAEALIENTLRAVAIVDCGEAGAAWSAALDAVRSKLAEG